MTIAQAMQQMEADRKKLSGLSVLNPDLSARDAWELIWRELIKLRSQYEPQTKLSEWLAKRVRQVCSNRLDPDLPDLVMPPGSTKKPDPFYYALPKKPLLILHAPTVVTTQRPPAEPDVETAPAPPKPKPFTRKFS